MRTRTERCYVSGSRSAENIKAAALGVSDESLPYPRGIGESRAGRVYRIPDHDRPGSWRDFDARAVGDTTARFAPSRIWHVCNSG